jgi:hypothetical protein
MVLNDRVTFFFSNAYRTTSEEKRALERVMMQEDPSSPYNYNAIRRASEAHRQVRAYARKSIKPVCVSFLKIKYKIC